MHHLLSPHAYRMHLRSCSVERLHELQKQTDLPPRHRRVLAEELEYRRNNPHMQWGTA